MLMCNKKDSVSLQMEKIMWILPLVLLFLTITQNIVIADQIGYRIQNADELTRDSVTKQETQKPDEIARRHHRAFSLFNHKVRFR
jgi:hypothetical protein